MIQRCLESSDQTDNCFKKASKSDQIQTKSSNDEISSKASTRYNNWMHASKKRVRITNILSNN